MSDNAPLVVFQCAPENIERVRRVLEEAGFLAMDTGEIDRVLEQLALVVESDQSPATPQGIYLGNSTTPPAPVIVDVLQDREDWLSPSRQYAVPPLFLTNFPRELQQGWLRDLIGADPPVQHDADH